MIAQFTPFPEMTTPRLLLRKVQPQDVHEIFFLRSDATVLRYIDTPPAESLEEAQEFISKTGNLEANNECVVWAMVPKGDERLIGTICFWNIEPARDKAEVGYNLHPGYHGYGLMNEAMNAILNYGFNTMQLKWVEAITNKDNFRSRRLLEKNNFMRDAELEEEKVGSEEPEYAVIYSLKK